MAALIERCSTDPASLCGVGWGGGYRGPVESAPFVSYAQNGEDVVLFRALGGVESGRYVDVGANDPVADSISYAFYLRGWSGITIDPVRMSTRSGSVRSVRGM